jgi:RNA polymerase sigma-70 factor (ECF subfamily)
MLAPTSLSQIFSAEARARSEVQIDGTALEPALASYLEAARRTRPEVGVADAEFVRYVAARATEGCIPPLAHAGDLLLACGCTLRDARAIAIFHDAYGAVIARVLRRRRASSDAAADATQTVHERLLVGAPGVAPKIGEYRGLGPLRSWVATTAALTLLMQRRAANRRREQPAETGLTSLVEDAAQVDPELAYMKERYKAHLSDAVSAALSALGDRERTLLRLHLGEQLSIDHLAAMYSVNRATAARWLSAIRKLLLEGAREHLRARLGLSESECNSLVVLVRSQLDLSIVRHLS